MCSKIMGGSKKIGGSSCSCSCSCSYPTFTTHLVSEIFQKEAFTMRNMNAKAFTKQLNGLPTPTKLRLANNLVVHKLFHVFTEFVTFVSTWGRAYIDALLCDSLHPLWKSNITQY